MYSLRIGDYLKCSHSFKGEIFGAAQILHVITYEIDVVFMTDKLDQHGLLVEFDAAHGALKDILSLMNFKNLDELPELNGKNTTTEFLCKYIHDHVCKRVADTFEGNLRVTLRESPIAECSYEAPVTKS